MSSGITRRSLMSGAALLLLLLASTMLPAQPAAGGSPEPAAKAGEAALPAFQTRDDRLAALAVPGFGGAFVDDKTGVLNVWTTGRGVTATAQAKAAQTALAGVLGPDVAGMPVKTLPGTYAFTTLKAWHDRVTTDVLSMPGVVMSDIDDRNNRLTIGVEQPDKQGALVAEKLAKLGVPSEAVTIEKAAPVELDNLQSAHRPTVGGLQITRVINSTTLGVCTLGFNAVRAGVQGFVTNAHCSSNHGAADGTSWWQALPGDGPIWIGNEAVDAPFFTSSPCPSGRICRASDASFARYVTLAPELPPTTSRGRVARQTAGGVAWSGSTTYRITAELIPSLGRGVRKIGRTTGTTNGAIDASCISTNITGTNFTYLCQDRAPYDADHGDSGAPVLFLTASPDAASLVGIHWGHSETHGFFSGIDTVEAELGALNTCVGTC